jgi:hypothetical protein
MTTRQASLRMSALVAVGAVLAAGCGGSGGAGRDGEAATHAAAEPASAAAAARNSYAWVSGGHVVAVRRAPLVPGAYGAHGVDWSPDIVACGRVEP